MIPSSGEQTAAAFDECFRQRWHGEAEAHETVVGIYDYREVLEAYDGHIHLNIVVDLLRSEWRVAVKLVVGLVDEFKQGTAVLCHQFLLAFEVHVAHAVFSADDVADSLVLVGDSFGHHHLEFHPAGVDFEAHSLHLGVVVGVVVDGCHCAELVEAIG